jgi:hypothetical protein
MRLGRSVGKCQRAASVSCNSRSAERRARSNLSTGRSRLLFSAIRCPACSAAAFWHDRIVAPTWMTVMRTGLPGFVCERVLIMVMAAHTVGKWSLEARMMARASGGDQSLTDSTGIANPAPTSPKLFSTDDRTAMYKARPVTKDSASSPPRSNSTVHNKYRFRNRTIQNIDTPVQSTRSELCRVCCSSTSSSSVSAYLEIFDCLQKMASPKKP